MFLSNSLYSLVWLDGMELMVIMVATFGQTMSAPAVGIDFFSVFIFWRFVVCLRPVITLPDRCPHLYYRDLDGDRNRWRLSYQCRHLVRVFFYTYKG